MNDLLVPASKCDEINTVINKRRIAKTSISDAETYANAVSENLMKTY